VKKFIFHSLYFFENVPFTYYTILEMFRVLLSIAHRRYNLQLGTYTPAMYYAYNILLKLGVPIYNFNELSTQLSFLKKPIIYSFINYCLIK